PSTWTAGGVTCSGWSASASTTTGSSPAASAPPWASWRGGAPRAERWGSARMPPRRPETAGSEPGPPTCRACSAPRSITSWSRRATRPPAASCWNRRTAAAATTARSSSSWSRWADSAVRSACETGCMSETENTTVAAQSSSTTRRQPFPRGFLDTISQGWADRPETLPVARAQAPYAARRRDAVSRAFPGRRLVVPAGGLRQRSNDTDYPFRAHSAFSHLTGWGADSEPDSMLVFEPTADGHDVTLYFR